MNIDQLKKNKDATINTIKKHIVSILNGNVLSRQTLISAIVSRLGFTKSELRNTCVDSACVLARSYIGKVITDAIEHGEIVEDDGLLRLQLNHSIPEKDAIEACLVEMLRKNVAMSKNEIFQACFEKLGADKTFSTRDDDVIRAVAGQALASFERREIVSVADCKYFLNQEKEDRLDALKSFLDSINTQGGEYFEQYGAALLRKYYEKRGFKVAECAVTGGSDDGGIDIVIRTEDMLGFKELIAVQAKARRNLHVSVKEVREFIGAMLAKGASRGIYLTTSHFHTEAEALIEQIPNLVKIDGKILYEIAQECKFFSYE